MSLPRPSFEGAEGCFGGVVGWGLGFLNGALVLSIARTHPYWAFWITWACMFGAPFVGAGPGKFLHKRAKKLAASTGRGAAQWHGTEPVEGEVLWRDIAPQVLAVAVVEDDWWNAYIDAVPGKDSDDEAGRVVRHGTGLSEEIASSIWPHLAALYDYRG